MKEPLSDRLCRLRTAKRLSVKEAAERIGVPVTTYREWEHGRKIVGEPYVQIARVFEVSVYELITGEKTSSSDISKIVDVIEQEIKKLKVTLLSN